MNPAPPSATPRKRKKAPSRMSADQSREDNKAAFVRRLMEAGWSRKEASEEYDRETA